MNITISPYFFKKSVLFIATLFLAIFLFGAATKAHAQAKMYVVNYNSADTAGKDIVSQANLDGTGPVNLGNPGGLLTGALKIALDVNAGKMYIADYDGDKIIQANLDGTGAVNLGNIGGFLNLPSGIALDIAAGKMYVVCWGGGGNVVRANLDGTDAENLVPNIGAAIGSAFSTPIGIALDLAAGKMYIAAATSHKIARGNLDGTGFEDLGNPGGFLNSPYGIALDTNAGKMYVASWGNNRVVRANLDGTDAENYGTLGLAAADFTGPCGVAMNVAAGKLYVTGWNSNTVVRANLDGTGGESLGNLGATLNEPAGIALDIPTPAIPSLNRWGMIILFGILGFISIWFIRSRRGRRHGTA